MQTATLHTPTSSRSASRPSDRALRSRERPLETAFRAIRATAAADLPIEAYAQMIGLSADQFTRLFKRQFGTTPVTCRLHRRLEMANELLQKEPETAISDIALRAGFRNLSFFYREYRKHFGHTPKAYTPAK